MACQQLITHVEASAQFLAKMPSSMRADAVAGQFNAVKLMLSRIQGPVEALQASNAINAGWGAFLNEYQKQEIAAVINRQAAALGPATGYSKQDWSGDFWQVLPKKLGDTLADQDLSASYRMLELFKYLAEKGLRLPNEKVFGAMLALFFYLDNKPPPDGASCLASINCLKQQWKNFIASYTQNLIGLDRASWTWPGLPANNEPRIALDKAKFVAIMSAIPLRVSNQMASRSDIELQVRKPTRAQQVQRPQLQLMDSFPESQAAALPLQVPLMDEKAGSVMTSGPEDVSSAARAGKAAAAGLALTDVARENAGDSTESPSASGTKRKSLAQVTDELIAASKTKIRKKPASSHKVMKKPAASIHHVVPSEPDDLDDHGYDDDDDDEPLIDAESEDEPIMKKPAAKACFQESVMKKPAAKALALTKPKATKATAKKAKQSAAGSSDSGKKVRWEHCCARCGAEEAELVDFGDGPICIYCKEAEQVFCGRCGADEPVLLDYFGDGQICTACFEAQAEADVGPEPAEAKDSKYTWPAPPAAVRERMRNGSPEVRVELFMQWGCAKCRWKPGCSNSCWKSRGMTKPAREAEDVN